MGTKRTIIGLLAGLNLVLLLALVLSLSWLPPAYAQARPGGRAGDYVMVTAKAAGQSYDVLYVLNVPERKLFALYPANVQTKQLAEGGFRDLSKDFRPE
jgi:hypothetical protein